MEWYKFILGPDSAWLWTMIQAIVVAISLPLIIRQIAAQVGQLAVQSEQLKNQNEQLKIQTEQLEAQRVTNMLAAIDSFDQRWDSPELMNARIQVCKQYLDHGKDILSPGVRVLLHYFEQMGVYYRHSVFSPEIVWAIFTESICRYWEICEGMIVDHRAVKSDTTFYEEFEYLKNSMNELSKQRGLAIKCKTAKEVREFANHQIEYLEIRIAEYQKLRNHDGGA